MKLRVYFTPLGLDSQTVSGKPLLVIDALRATTTIVTALANGAKSVLPADSADEAMRLAHDLDSVVLAGEQNYKPIPGFQLGNSPSEMTEEVVAGKTVVMLTTNGTGAIVASRTASPVLIGAAVNFQAAVKRAKAAFKEAGELTILCAGHGMRFALEDAYVAGRFAKALLPARATGVEIDDATIAALQLVRHYGEKWKGAFTQSRSARNLKELGLGADVQSALEVDRFDIVPTYAERQVRV